MNFTQTHVRRLCCVLFCALLPALSQAQIMFERTYGGAEIDYASCVLQTSDGGYLIAGSTSSYGAGSSDIYLIKTDAFGDTLWTKTYGGNGDDYAATLNLTPTNGYIIAGQTNSFGAGSSDGFIIRINWLGDTLWSRTLGGVLDDNAYISAIDDDGSLLTVGTTFSYCTGGSAIYVNKIDSTGGVLWTKVFQKFPLTSGGSATKKINGFYYILGSTDDGGGGILSKLYLLKINDGGDTSWSITYDNPSGALKNAIIDKTPDNYLIISGRIEYLNGEADLLLMKTDLSGIPLWFKTYGGSGFQGGGKFAQTADGGFLLTGVSGDATKMMLPYKCTDNNVFSPISEKGWTNGDLIIIKIANNGDSLWSRTYGGTGEDAGASVQQTDDNGFIACGYRTTETNADIYLIKTDFNGIAQVSCFENETEKIVITPNPCHGRFKIKVLGINDEQAPLRLMDSHGQLVLSSLLTRGTTTEIDITHMNPGLYIINIKGSKTNISRKIILIK